MMTSPDSDAEGLLDRAIGLLVVPTLENLGQVERLLGEAVSNLAERGGGESVALKVRLCGRLLEAAEAARPGCGSWGGYDARGERPRPMTSRFVLDV